MRPGHHAARLIEVFRSVHQEEGCELTDQPARGRRWRDAAGHRERRALERAAR